MLMLFEVLERGAVREPLTGTGSFWRRYGVRGMSQLQDEQRLVKDGIGTWSDSPSGKYGRFRKTT